MRPPLSRLLCLLGTIAALCTASNAETAPPGPCLGYNLETQNWLPVGNGVTVCPANHALLSVIHGAGAVNNPAERTFVGSCCPLPPGMLTGESVVAPLRCPPDTVATGFVISKRLPPTYELFCGALDTKRFKTGAASLGAEVSSERGHLGEFIDALQGIDPRRLPHSRVPATFRYSVGRMGRIRWSFPACIGLPFEGILVGRSGKRCVEHEFASVLDRSTGEPVPLFPPCAQVSDPLDHRAKCINP